ncbi:hypothetical protein GALMADRAFT_283484 [Galerina marginata CBS 339.88]|uniref:DUF985 domain-containing protein n=1 Tax=Galerina marginata (strain CBS 339.88) TaxID=685588 RepID=A0A067SC18_GALM3|nr:hypothetical protein GALMADRAFT_283484 [Galerina marginata CBS 339.88]
MTGQQHPSTTAELITQLALQKHPEGGYYVETDRQTKQIPTPFVGGEPRSLATSIYYLLTDDNPNGVFHMNKSVTYHVLHQGRAEYTLIKPTHPPVVERVIIGTDTSAGEVRMLLVDTNVWKMSRLLPQDVERPKSRNEEDSSGCLITEVVVPGFHWEDHQFLTQAVLQALFEGVDGGEERVREFSAFLKK